MLHRLTNPVLIVDANVADSRDMRADVHEDQRHFAETQVFDQRVFHAEGEDGDAIDATLDHPAHRDFHALGIVNGGGQKDFVVVLNRDVFKSLDDFRKEGVGDFGDDEAEDSASAGNQRTRLGVRVVPEFVDNFPDALGELGVDAGDAIDGS